jgi:hypothetical protein
VSAPNRVQSPNKNILNFNTKNRKDIVTEKILLIT